MLNTRDRGVLLEIHNHCNRIEDKMANQSFADFETNIDCKEIVAFNLLQIGELAKKLSPDFTSEYPEIPWKPIKGMRDHIVHGYSAIDFEVIYNTANENIKELNLFCSNLLKENMES